MVFLSCSLTNGVFFLLNAVRAGRGPRVPRPGRLRRRHPAAVRPHRQRAAQVVLLPPTQLPQLKVPTPRPAQRAEASQSWSCQDFWSLHMRRPPQFRSALASARKIYTPLFCTFRLFLEPLPICGVWLGCHIWNGSHFGFLSTSFMAHNAVYLPSRKTGSWRRRRPSPTATFTTCGRWTRTSTRPPA